MQTRAPIRFTGEEPVEVLPVHGEEQVELHAAEDGGIVDQEVDPAEVLTAAAAMAAAESGSATSTPAPSAVPPAAAMACGHLGGVVLVDVGHHHRGPGRGQRLGVGLPDAPPEPVTTATLPLKS